MKLYSTSNACVINKMINWHTVNYHPSPSTLTSRVHLLIFLWTPKGFISPEYFLNFFSNVYIAPWLQKSFIFMVLRLLENTFVSQKIESVYFCSCPQANLSPRFLSSLQAGGNNPYSPRHLKYWVGVLRGQSYLMGRRCLFSLGWPPF